jgi:hypothetical protein
MYISIFSSHSRQDLVTINRAFCLEKKIRTMGMKREENKSTHAHTNVIMNKNKKKKKG